MLVARLNMRGQESHKKIMEGKLMNKPKKAKKKNRGAKLSIPKLSEKKEKALRTSSEKIDTLCRIIERVPVTSAVKIGKELVKDEKIMFGEGESRWGKWGPYRKEFFPNLTPKRIERYLKLGRFVNLAKFKGLASLPQTTLLQLITLGEGVPVGKFLAKHKIDAKVKPKDREAITGLKAQAKKLISRLKEDPDANSSKKSAGESKTVTVNTFKKWVSDMGRCLDSSELMESLAEHAENDKKFTRDLKKLRKKIREIYEP
jgi:hypothetical protein